VTAAGGRAAAPVKSGIGIEETAAAVGDVTPRVGVSSCLLGQPVRYNGGHSRNRFISDVLAGYVEWVPVCPEIEIGLGAPRESLHLTGDGQLVSGSGKDHTAAVAALAQRRTELTGLDGYVVKSRSPSCGLYSVRVHANGRIVAGNGRGLFAARVLAADPLLPAEEEGRLNDPLLRESFVEQVWARARLNQLFGGRWRLRDLIGFHARHKLQLMAHDPVRAHQAGHLVAVAHGRPDDEVRAGYTALFGEALARRVSRARHCNAMHHAFGLVSDHLDDTRRHGILATIDAYRRGEVPLSVPVTLLRHHADGCNAVYLAAQTYLDPFPAGLGLRNHAPGPSAPAGNSGESRQSGRGPAPKTPADATKGARG
jgi:uncharacterized protein YbgA (DUF1722 family)/uncharacterized protein YbbK (DUF523 family)